jgi:hypothetical protein
MTFKFMSVKLGGWDIDFITGFIKAVKRAAVVSTRIMDTVYKMVGYAVLLSMMHVLFYKYIPNSGPEGTCLFPTPLIESIKVIPFAISGLMIIREAASIVENLAEAGILPKAITNLLAKIFVSIQDSLSKDRGNDISK